MNKLKITVPDWKTLAEHAFAQSKNNFYDAIKIIDDKFGEGYAETHPQLVGDFLKAAATETSGTMIYMGLQHIDETITEIMSNNGIVNELENIKRERRDLDFVIEK